MTTRDQHATVASWLRRARHWVSPASAALAQACSLPPSCWRTGPVTTLLGPGPPARTGPTDLGHALVLHVNV